MTEFIYKKSDYVNSDLEKDRRGVHKKGDCINYKPDGWSSKPGWAESSYPQKFIVIKCPEIDFAEAKAFDYRKPWQDDLDYEIVASRPAQGEYDVRVFEKNIGAINQNSIAGVKAMKIRNYLQAWGCSNFSMSETDATFTFSLWNAIRSANLWDVGPEMLAQISFELVSYSGATEIGTVRITVPESLIREAKNKITSNGGTITNENENVITFQIERPDILRRFKQDVKNKMQIVYKRHQYSISTTEVDVIESQGGIVTMSKTELLGKLINHLEN
jgi:hypothetical protein